MKLVCSLLLIPCFIHAKVLLITHSYNRPEFIEIQAKTFKSFLKDDYEYVVFNDAPDQKMKEAIEETCKKVGIKCFRIPQCLHNIPNGHYPGYRHMVGIKYSLQKLGFNHCGIVAFVDSDMFLIKPLSIETYLAGYNIAGDLQKKGDQNFEISYISPALVFMNMNTLPNKLTLNFDGGVIAGLLADVGGSTYYYLNNNPNLRLNFFDCIHISTLQERLRCTNCSAMTCENCVNALRVHGFDEPTITFIQECPKNIEFFLNRTFLHYRGGSNWDGQSKEYHYKKMKALDSFLSKIL